MKIPLFFMIAGFLTGLAFAHQDEQAASLSPEQMEYCVNEAAEAVADYQPGELVSRVANEILEKLDTYESMEEISNQVVELVGGIGSEQAKVMIHDCDALDKLVRPTLYRGSCGPDFGWEIDIHGEDREQYLEGHEHLAVLIAYKGVCDSFTQRDDMP